MEDLFRSIDHELPSRILDPEELQIKLNEVQDRLKEAKRKLSEIAKENEKRTRNNTKIEIIQAQTDGFIEKLTLAKELLSEQKELDSNLEILKKAFSTNGLLLIKLKT